MHHPFSVLKYVSNLYRHTSLVIVDDMSIQRSWIRVKENEWVPYFNDVVDHVMLGNRCWSRHDDTFFNTSMTNRLTSAQIIALGDYLRPDFDPSTLTVSQLLGLLGYHNVTYPTPYSKSKLIQCFEEEIKYKADNLRKERLKKANSIAQCYWLS